MIAICFLLLADMPVVDTGLFRLNGDQVKVTKDGTLFWLDSSENKLWMHREGTTSEVARRGQGPGDVGQVQRCYLVEDALYVVNAHSINIFSSKGEALRKHQMKYVGEAFPVADGCFLKLDPVLGKGHKLVFSRYEEPSVWIELAEWEKEPVRINPRDFHSKKPAPLNPFPDASLAVVDYQSGQLYLRKPFSDVIEVYSVADLQHKFDIEVQLPPVPMNRALAEEIVEEQNKFFRARGSKTSFVARPGDYFPSMYLLSIDVYGNLLVYRKDYQSNTYRVLSFQPNGEEIEPLFSVKANNATFGIYKGLVGIVRDGPDGTKQLAFVSREKVNDLFP